jgi:hypothetical protein
MRLFRSFRLDSANQCLWRGEHRVPLQVLLAQRGVHGRGQRDQVFQVSLGRSSRSAIPTERPAAADVLLNHCYTAHGASRG